MMRAPSCTLLLAGLVLCLAILCAPFGPPPAVTAPAHPPTAAGRCH